MRNPLPSIIGDVFTPGVICEPGCMIGTALAGEAGEQPHPLVQQEPEQGAMQPGSYDPFMPVEQRDSA